ncbi:hypothetical protein H112_07225 [Trichophyton rubrum D6]|nr:hypothetical protein H112_07225 [Trichophyton rubrum D6]
MSSFGFNQRPSMASFGIDPRSSGTTQIFRVSLFKSTPGSIKQSTCGLGKIIQARGLIYIAATRRTSNFLPTIVVAQSSCLDKMCTVDDLSSILAKHPPSDPSSSYVVVLTTYQTFYHRFTIGEKETTEGREKKWTGASSRNDKGLAVKSWTSFVTFRVERRLVPAER